MIEKFGSEARFQHGVMVIQQDGPAKKKCQFGVESKSFEISLELVKEKIVGKIL